MSIVCWLILLGLFEVFSNIYMNTATFSIKCWWMGTNTRNLRVFNLFDCWSLWILISILNFSCAEIHELFQMNEMRELQKKQSPGCTLSAWVALIFSAMLVKRTFSREAKHFRSKPNYWCLVICHFENGLYDHTEVPANTMSQWVVFISKNYTCMSVCEIQRQREREQVVCNFQGHFHWSGCVASIDLNSEDRPP